MSSVHVFGLGRCAHCDNPISGVSEMWSRSRSSVQRCVQSEMRPYYLKTEMRTFCQALMCLVLEDAHSPTLRRCGHVADLQRCVHSEMRPYYLKTEKRTAKRLMTMYLV